MRSSKFKAGDLVVLNPNLNNDYIYPNNSKFKDHFNKVFIVKKVQKTLYNYLLIFAFGSPGRDGIDGMLETRFQLYKLNK